MYYVCKPVVWKMLYKNIRAIQFYDEYDKMNNNTDWRVYLNLWLQKCPKKMGSGDREVNFITFKAPLLHCSSKHRTRWGCDVVMVSCELKCITSSCFITVKYRCSGLQVVCLGVCGLPGFLCIHHCGSAGQTNLLPVSSHCITPVQPAASSASRLSWRQTEDGSSRTEMDYRRFTLFPCDLKLWLTVCVLCEYFLKILTWSEETLVKEIVLDELIISWWIHLHLEALKFDKTSQIIIKTTTLFFTLTCGIK